jgi:hypothetical protein
MNKPKDELVEAIDIWLRENLGDYINPSDAKHLARVIRNTREFRLAARAQQDLQDIFDLSDVVRREREATGDE